MKTDGLQTIVADGLMFERMVLALRLHSGKWRGVVRFQRKVWEVERVDRRRWKVLGPAASYYSMGGSQGVLQIG